MKPTAFALLLPLASAVTAFPAERGVYFPKKAYVPTPLPTFTQAREELPGPVLEGRPDLVALYWRAWELGYRHLRAPAPGSPLVSNWMDAAFSKHLFQWDTIFMVPFASYGHHVFPMVESLDNFYARQRVDGFINREIVAATGADYVYRHRRNTVNPPLFAWAEVRHARLTGDTSRFPLVYQALVKHAEWLEKGRRKEGTAHGLYWNTPLGSGMDNTPRSGSGWVDMSSQMVMLYENLAEIAQALGRPAEAAEFRARASAIAGRIRATMWNERDGLFYDVDDRGQQRPRKTIACFWPLIAGVATPAQAARLVAHLKDPRSFWRPMPWPTLAADDPKYSPVGRYWRGGVWAPTNAMVVGGLKRYPEVPGALDLARAGAEKYLEALSRSHGRTGTLWEFYQPENGQRGVMWWFLRARPDFVGWSGIGPIQFLLEDVLGLDVDALAGVVKWNLRRTDRHGVRGLRIGSARVDLLAEPRADDCALVELSVDAAGAPLPRLEVTFGGTSHVLALGEGARRYRLDPRCPRL